MSGKVLFGLFGASGFGREVMPFAREVLQNKFAGSDIQVVFVETQPAVQSVNGMSVISEAEFYNNSSNLKFFNVAIADSKIREKIVNNCLTKNVKPLSLQAANVLSFDHNECGEGAIICPFSMITSNARIGKFFHSNIYSYVAHDCVIGDYVTFAPRVSCNGNVHIGNHAYIGTNAVIKQGTKDAPLVIGEGAVVGMGAVVTKNVPPHTTVVGNPARPFEKNKD